MIATIDAANVVADLSAISLPELQREAAWLTRADRKYLVPIAALDDILTGFAGARVLEIDGRRCFRYTTVYFDDDQLASYCGALRRRPGRFKVRTRRYDESGLCHLEVKRRDGRGRTVKDRRPHDPGCLARLTIEERAWLRTVPQIGYRTGGLRHRLTTVYQRSTLVLPSGAARVTIDRDLAVALPAGENLTIPTLAIIEIKGPGKATLVDRTLWQHGYRPEALSKYALGLALLIPELPANRWHRLRERLQEIAVPGRPVRDAAGDDAPASGGNRSQFAPQKVVISW